jgi:hypothetical protein
MARSSKLQAKALKKDITKCKKLNPPVKKAIAHNSSSYIKGFDRTVESLQQRHSMKGKGKRMVKKLESLVLVPSLLNIAVNTVTTESAIDSTTLVASLLEGEADPVRTTKPTFNNQKQSTDMNKFTLLGCDGDDEIIRYKLVPSVLCVSNTNEK